MIEDDATLRAALCRVLQASGYDVREGADGVSGLRAYREHGADLVILDIFMPHLDGLEVIRTLRAGAGGPRIIAVSGGGHVVKMSILESAQQLGADRILHKPFTPGMLLAAIRDVLEEDPPRQEGS